LTGRVGIFGGTFSPPHAAHLRVASVALAQCGLAEIVFVPSGTPPHKPDGDGATREDRFEMVQRAVAGAERLSVSRVEIDREGPSYTIDTLRQLKASIDADLCFIVGADLLLDITTWRAPQELLGSVPFVLAPRRGITRDRFDAAVFHGAELHFLDMEEIDLSSTWVRERIARGEPYEDRVPEGVVEYIEDRRLYHDRQPAIVHP
jgi:nicotinate-nucleotide adenylyltransferase